MKKCFIIITFLLAFNAMVAQSSGPRIYISTYVECDSVRKSGVSQKMSFFEENTAIKLSEVYDCAAIKTSYEVKLALDQVRTIQLISDKDTQGMIKEIGSSLVCDYLVNLKIVIKENTAIVSAAFLDNKNINAMSRATVITSFETVNKGTYDDIAEQLIEGLKTYEICPYKGTIDINIVSTKKDKQTEEYSVYCNQGDGIYRKTTTLDNYSENNWAIEKTNKNAARGNVRFSLSEETKIEEDNSCYECSPGKQGPRTYLEKTTTYADIQGLSNESESYGIKVDDARVYITFFENGTYTIRVKAASRQGEKKSRKEVIAQGVCHNINEKPEPINSKVDEGINEIFGPFTGNAQDKVLAEKDAIKKIDPVTNEESVIEYEFNLKLD
jgi:hypothetical protein